MHATTFSLYQCISRSVLLVLVPGISSRSAVICNNYSGEYTIKMMCDIFKKCVICHNRYAKLYTGVVFNTL